MEFQWHLVSRMDEMQFSRMQKISLQFAVFLHEPAVVPFAIHVVANDRMSDSAEVHADLVCSACFDFHLQK